MQGAAFTAIEPEHGINDLCHFGDSGLLLMATEDSKMLSYYIPVKYQLGCFKLFFLNTEATTKKFLWLIA